jgi:hypothetical protein
MLIFLAILASTVAARPQPHLAWVGEIVGLNGAPTRGELVMYGGLPPNSTYAQLTQHHDSAGAVRPWLVRRGSCADPGPIFGEGTALPPLRIGADGQAVGKVTWLIAVPDSGAFHVTVADSPRNPGRIIACGDLVLED